MPIRNDEIPAIDHKPYCQGPNIAALYIRTQRYDEVKKKRIRTTTNIGLKCLSCRVSIDFPLNLTGRRMKKLQDSVKALPKILSDKDRTGIDEIEHKLTNTRTLNKEVQLALSPEEIKYAKKLKELNGIYKKDQKVCPRLKGGRINWDPKLLQRFIDSRPTFNQVRKLMLWPPLYRVSRKKANRSRGWIPNFEKGGYSLDFDHLHFNLERDNFVEKMNMFFGDRYGELPDEVNLDELSPWEKLVIEECNGRMEYMQSVIEENLKTKIILHPVQEKDKDKDKDKISLGFARRRRKNLFSRSLS